MQILTFSHAEKLLDNHRLQALGNNGRWYDLRRNGATKRWKTRPHRASIPVKLGFREAFRLEFDDAARRLRSQPAGETGMTYYELALRIAAPTRKYKPQCWRFWTPISKAICFTR